MLLSLLLDAIYLKYRKISRRRLVIMIYAKWRIERFSRVRRQKKKTGFADAWLIYIAYYRHAISAECRAAGGLPGFRRVKAARDCRVMEI